MLAALPAAAQEFITVASTTSTENSGLFGHILPIFQAETGIEVRVVAQGTGPGAGNRPRGDADVVFVHARAQEDKFVAEGWSVQRFDVMYNDFVIVGPGDDPAGLRRATAADAMAKRRRGRAPFASRGDDSGTHVAEKNLWKAAGSSPPALVSVDRVGHGRHAEHRRQVPAYALTDRGTWLSFQNRGPLEIVFEGDPVLFNPYGIMLVNPERHPHVKAEAGQAFIDWIISDAGQAAIAGFKVGGEQLFFPSAGWQSWFCWRATATPGPPHRRVLITVTGLASADAFAIIPPDSEGAAPGEMLAATPIDMPFG
jgi:tungstate transport system substrate-binding protein